MSLEELLQHSRTPKHLRTHSVRQEVARLAFEAMKRNQANAKKTHIKKQKNNRIESVTREIESWEKITIKNLDELKEYISILLGKDPNSHWGINENGINHWDLFWRYLAKTLFLFCSVKLGFSENINQLEMPNVEWFIKRNEKIIIEHIQTKSPKICDFCEQIGIDLPKRKMIKLWPIDSTDNKKASD